MLKRGGGGGGGAPLIFKRGKDEMGGYPPLWCLNIYIYVYVHIYMYTYIYICIYTCIYRGTGGGGAFLFFKWGKDKMGGCPPPWCLDRYIYVDVHIYIYIHTYICIYAYILWGTGGGGQPPLYSEGEWWNGGLPPPLVPRYIYVYIHVYMYIRIHIYTYIFTHHSRPPRLFCLSHVTHEMSHVTHEKRNESWAPLSEVQHTHIYKYIFSCHSRPPRLLCVVAIFQVESKEMTLQLDTLQHTATHCNTLQHSTIHRNNLSSLTVVSGR